MVQVTNQCFIARFPDSSPEFMMQAIEHPLMGRLEWSEAETTSDWSGVICLPSFAECYEKWNDDGTEFFRDRRTDAHRQGIFDILVLSGTPWAAIAPGKEADEDREPSAPQCAAYQFLRDQHAALADSLRAELANDVRERELGWGLDETEIGFLLRPEIILGTLSLYGICLTYHTKDDIALVGMTFHSEIWDDEHGLGAVVHRDKVIHIGATEDAWPDSMMGDRWH